MIQCFPYHKNIHSIYLKGLAIGDGLCDPPHQMDYGDFLYQVGLLDESDRNLVELRGEMAKIAMKNEQWHLASNVRRFFLLPPSFSDFFCELSDVAKPLHTLEQNQI